MLARRRTALLVAALLLPVLSVLSWACSKRDLVIDGPGIGHLDGGPLDAGTAGGPMAGASGTGGTGGQRIPPLDAGASDCVGTTVLLPWTEPSAMAPMRLEVATSSAALAVLNRQADQLDVRTYGRDGSVIGGFQFAWDTQVLASRDSRFVLVTRGQSGDLVATAIDANLIGSTRLYSAPAHATEHILSAIALPTTVIVLTTEHFVNLATGTTVQWTDIIPGLFPGEPNPFSTSVPYGLATDGSRVLMAWGDQNNLWVAVIDASGTLVAQEQQLKFLDYPTAQPPTAIPYDGGLLLFDGNAVRATKIGFDLSRTVLGANTELRTFYRTAPKVAAIVLQGHPVAFWLTVFPATDNTQGSTPHHLYGCQLDLAAPASCLGTAPIASTTFTGYGVGQEPVAAAAFPDGTGFAIAHTDTDGYSWLNIADLSCATPRAAP
jgi:hypothetical protein